MADFSKEITAAGAGWVNALAIAQANGYTGGAPTTFCTVEEKLGNDVRIKTGHSSGTVAPVSATDGKSVSGGGETMYGTDLGVMWIYIGGAFAYNLSFHSDIDY